MSFVRSRRRGRVPHEGDSDSEDEDVLISSDQDIFSEDYDESDDENDYEDETSEDENGSTDSEGEGESEDVADAGSAAVPSSSLKKEYPPSAQTAKTTTAAAENDERKTAEGGTGEKSELTEREKQILQRHEYRRRKAATEDQTSAPGMGPSFEPHAGQFWDHDNRYRQDTTLQHGTAEDGRTQHALPASDPPTTTTTTTALQPGSPSANPPQPPMIPPHRRRRQNNFRRVPEELLNNRWTHDGYEELMQLEEREEREGRAHKDPPAPDRQSSNYTRPTPAHPQPQPQQRRSMKRVNGASREWQMFDGSEDTRPALSANIDSISKETSPDAGTPADGEKGHPEREEPTAVEDTCSHQRHDADETLDWSETGTLSARLPASSPLVQKNDGGAQEAYGWSSAAAPVLETRNDKLKKKAPPSQKDFGWDKPGKQNGNGPGSNNNTPSADGWSAEPSQQQPENDRKPAWKSSAVDDDDNWKQSATWAQDGDGGASAAHDSGDRKRINRHVRGQENASRIKGQQQEQVPRGERASSKWRKEPHDGQESHRSPKEQTPKSGERRKPRSAWPDETQEGADHDWKKAATWVTGAETWSTTATAKDKWSAGTEKKELVDPVQQQPQQNKRATTRGYLSQKKPSSLADVVPTKTEVPTVTKANPPTVIKQTEGRGESVESKSEPPAPSSFSYSFDAEPWKPSFLPREDARGHERFIEEQEEQESDVEIILEADTPASNGDSEVGTATPPASSNVAADVSTPTQGTPREKHQPDLDSDWRRRERLFLKDEDQQPMIRGGPFFYPPQQQMGYMAMSGATPPPPPPPLPPFAIPMQAGPRPAGSEAGGVAIAGSSGSVGDQDGQYLPSSYEANGMVYYSVDPSAVYPYYYYAPVPMMVPAGHMPTNGGDDPDEGWGPVPDQSVNEGEGDWQTDKQSRNNQQPNQPPAYGSPFYYYPSSQYYT